jgi:hypothetical protein
MPNECNENASVLKKLKLRRPRFVPFNARELKPSGWLKRQLEIQAAGLSGNLDKIWPDVRDSAWIGGNHDGWERVPYWLDGFIPLAWLLDDADLQGRAQRYVDHIIASQREDGWLCPCADTERGRYDIWAFFLICKVLALYADCSGDKRIETVLSKALRSIARHIEGATLFNWAASRWYEGLISIFWLYERTGEAWLLDLARRLEIQGIDYEKLFTNYMDTVPQRKWTYLTHGPNLAMCLKAGALASRIYGGDPNAFAQKAVETLFQYHGTATGHFTADECLAGTSPIQGTELCSITEAMYSYEVLLSVSGHPRWADYLEYLAFNALPASISPDMWTHQYDEMANQAECSYLPKDKVIFATNSRESHLFGLEPNFGCCTANFNQGWPKLALSTFMRADDGIASAVLVPSELACEINGRAVKCRLETEYPFREKLFYTVEVAEPVTFTFYIRIPEWAAAVEVEGQKAVPGSFFALKKEWRGRTEIAVSLRFETKLISRPHTMYCLRRGPLLYSVAPRERWEKREYVRDGVERKYPYCDYEVFAESPWNYAFTGFSLESCEVAEAPLPDIPFSPLAPPVSIKTVLVPIEWGFENGVCETYPEGKVSGKSVPVTLIPYGCTNLRITEMPMAE